MLVLRPPLPLPPRLTDAQLQLRFSLPLKPAPVRLEGRFVHLAPLDVARDAAALLAVSNGEPARLRDRYVDRYDAEELIWRYMFGGPYENLDQFRRELERQRDAPNALCLCVFDAASGQQVGAASFMNNSPDNLKIELGSIWYSPLVQRTLANTEATYLMLRHAFELGYRRVEWKCHSDNHRSRRAALRMGFRFEGIQEMHMIVKERSRDTAWFRILANEWADAKLHLESQLAAA
ncbi:MAG: GNAT family N-acetyltransferase [Caldilineaceae bacterium]|nr:GNAT family N-acetyltransferase [Caldilineaceae bacterium]